MSFGLGDGKRPGIFDSFRAAMAPKELPPDDGQPLRPPGTVTAATVLAMLAGLVFLLIGGVSLATTEDQLNNAVKSYNASISECTIKYGGIGEAVVVPSGPPQDVTAAQDCQTYVVLTDSAISAAKTQNIVISVVIVVIGLIALAGGWFLRQGARWGRLAVAGSVVLSVIITMLYQIPNIFTLGATLVMIIAVMLCYIGQGAVYFARLKARRTG